MSYLTQIVKENASKRDSNRRLLAEIAELLPDAALLMLLEVAKDQQAASMKQSCDIVELVGYDKRRKNNRADSSSRHQHHQNSSIDRDLIA